MTLKDLEKLTSEYAEAHNELATAVTNLNDQIAALKRQHLGQIKRLTAKAATRKATLHTAIDTSRDLFQKPRTHVFAEVKIGLAKQRGSIDFEDADAVVERIRKSFPNWADDLIRTREVPDKTALQNLTVAELKKLGCEVTLDGDKVVIAPVAGEVEKIVAALLKDATDNIIETTEAA